MRWDIYGNSLRRGFCEVHPGIPEPFPCGLCQAEQAEAWNAYMEQQQSEYEAYQARQEYEAREVGD